MLCRGCGSCSTTPQHGQNQQRDEARRCYRARPMIALQDGGLRSTTRPRRSRLYAPPPETTRRCLRLQPTTALEALQPLFHLAYRWRRCRIAVLKDARLASALARTFSAMTFVIQPLIVSDTARSRRRYNERNRNNYAPTVDKADIISNSQHLARRPCKATQSAINTGSNHMAQVLVLAGHPCFMPRVTRMQAGCGRPMRTAIWLRTYNRSSKRKMRRGMPAQASTLNKKRWSSVVQALA